MGWEEDRSGVGGARVMHGCEGGEDVHTVDDWSGGRQQKLQIVFALAHEFMATVEE